MKGIVRNTLEILSYAKLKDKTKDENILKKIKDKDNLHWSSELDLSELIFGTTNLKGRVFFSHFKAYEAILPIDEKSEILGTPQPKENKLGWKNYPILNELKKGKGGRNDNIRSNFIPLEEGVKFQGKIRFHNLRDFELGALLSALTFHKSSLCYHNIGLGKALGYGKIEVTVQKDSKYLEKYLGAFENKINAYLFEGKIKWNNSPYIEKLLEKHSNGEVKKTEIYSEKNKVEQLYRKYRDKVSYEQYEHIKNSNNIKKIKDFIQKYPDFEYNEDLKEKITLFEKIEREKIIEKKAQNEWEILKQNRDIDLFKQFILKYPNTKFINEAENKIDKLIKMEEKAEKAKENIKNRQQLFGKILNKKKRKR